jgi:hydroxyversicolorone monooxygenase
MGISVPGFPNMFCGSGPYWTTANGSLIDPMNTASKYVVQVIQKLQFEHNIVGVEPNQEALDDWVEHAQTWVKGMVWSGNCPAWYKVSEGKNAGRTNAVWPGITLHMVKAMSKVRWEDYKIERRLSGKSNTNRFQFLGHGLVKESVDPELDDTPHFSLANIDPRWTKATRLTWVPGMQAVERPQVHGDH